MSNHQAVLAEIAKINQELEFLRQKRIALNESNAKESDNTNKLIGVVLAAGLIAVFVGIGWGVMNMPKDDKKSTVSNFQPTEIKKNPVVKNQDDRNRKISEIIKTEINARCSNWVEYNADTNSQGAIVVKVSCPKYDNNRKLWSYENKEWISEASLLLNR